MSDDGISVVIPVYNAEKTIEMCLESICKQTYTNLQIICIDDGSKDGSLQIISELQKKDERIEVYSQSNSGPGAARNNGILHAKKRYITFVDSDDEIEPDMYERMYTFLKKNQLDCVNCDFSIVVSGKITDYIITPIQKEVLSGKNEILEDIIKPLIEFNDQPYDGLPSMCNKLFDRKIIQKHNLQVNTKRNHGEDWLFCINYFKYANRVGFIHEPFYHYIRWHDDSLLNKLQPQFLEMRLESETLFREWFPELEWTASEPEKKLLTLPIQTVEYYRLNLKGKELKKKIENIYKLCVENEVYRKNAERNDRWKSLIKDRKAFDKYIWRKSTKTTVVKKIKRFIKKILTIK